jgi:hypothetical protein
MLAFKPACKPFCPIGYKVDGAINEADHDAWVADPTQVPSHCKKMCDDNQIWDTSDTTPFDGV